MSDQFNDGFDHEFLAIHDSDIEWEEDLANELLTLPKGLKPKFLLMIRRWVELT